MEQTLHSQIEGVGGALTMSLIAFTVVFLVLGGLSGIIYAIKYMAAGLDRKKGGGTPAPAAPSMSAPAAAPAAPSPSPAAGADRNRLLAVLTAAVAATEGRPVRIAAGRPLAAAAPTGGHEWRRMGILEGLGGLSRD